MFTTRRLLVISICGMLSELLLQGEVVWGKVYSVGSLTLFRGHVRSLVMGVPCPDRKYSCSLHVSWEYKTSTEEPWKNLSSAVMHETLPAVYFLKNLEPDKLYYIRAYLSPPGRYTPTTEAWTCPTEPPSVTSLRVAGSGPGWLDVRWKRPREKCKSNIIFLVNYNAENFPPGPEKTFGLLDTKNGYASTDPLHPCPDPRTEFCVLLTDRVQPGRYHIVQVRVKRYDIDDSAITEPQKILALADTQAFGPPEATCPELKEITGVIEFPLWSVVCVGVVVFLLLIVATNWLFLSTLKENPESPDSDIRRTIEEIPPKLNVSSPNFYDYPQLLQGKSNTELF